MVAITSKQASNARKRGKLGVYRSLRANYNLLRKKGLSPSSIANSMGVKPNTLKGYIQGNIPGNFERAKVIIDDKPRTVSRLRNIRGFRRRQTGKINISKRLERDVKLIDKKGRVVEEKEVTIIRERDFPFPKRVSRGFLVRAKKELSIICRESGSEIGLTGFSINKSKIIDGTDFKRLLGLATLNALNNRPDACYEYDFTDDPGRNFIQRLRI